jgi:hypothetical protein
MELAAICKERQFNLESLTTNSTLKQSKSIEISKGLVLILKTYCVYEKERARRISSIFEKKKEGRRTYQGWYKAFIIGALVIDCDNEASPSFWWDCDRRGCGTGTSSSIGGTMIVRPYETSSSGRTVIGGSCSRIGTSSSSGKAMIAGPYGTGTSSSFDGTAVVRSYNSETSFSPTRMRFTLGTSSSPTCVMPNSSFNVSNIICKNRNIPK